MEVTVRERNQHRRETLQWGHGDEAVEENAIESYKLRHMVCFNGATAMKPWKRLGRLRISRESMRCFNGATAMKPWKSASLEPALHRPLLLQWGHGDEAVEEHLRRYTGFNSAWLQWGHGDEAVEESMPLEDSDGHLDASMGPRR